MVKKIINYQSLFVFRNCFTGDVSGGDTHMVGLLTWMVQQMKPVAISLVRPKNDGQQLAYTDVQHIKNITYKNIFKNLPLPIDYFGRSILATFIKLPVTTNSIYIASSHFLPDILPVFLKGGSKDIRIAYIHHIVRDMPREHTINNRLANAQETFSFWLIKKRFHKIIVVNEPVRHRLGELGFNKHSIFVSSNFVSRPKLEQNDYTLKSFDMIFCGRLVVQKGIYDFIEAFEILAKKNPNMKAVMIGKGPEIKSLKSLIDAKKLDVKLVGYVSDDEKLSYLRSSKFFVFPSYEEGWGIAIAESLAAGVPVIAYELPVYEAIFGNHITVTAHNATALASAIEDNDAIYRSNPSKYANAAEAIRMSAAKFDIEAVAKSEFDYITKARFDE